MALPTLAASRAGGILLALALLTAAARPARAQSSGGGHDCFIRDPTLNTTCKHPLLDDGNCTVMYGDRMDSWERMDCDVMIYNIPAKKTTNKVGCTMASPAPPSCVCEGRGGRLHTHTHTHHAHTHT